MKKAKFAQKKVANIGDKGIISVCGTVYVRNLVAVDKLLTQKMNYNEGGMLNMHTSLSKKLLAGLLSLVMVLSLVAPSMGTQAASKYSLTDKKSVKSDVTFKYQLKGVSKNQYVKITRNVSGETVKYNKKAVSKTTKINGTGKTLNLYVTYGDKVANYTGKFTVKIYSKKTNKVVKTIVEKTTVKVAELKVTGVEKASDSGKYLVATFNKKLDTLKVSDITIREKATGIMKGVESVTLASDGKTATVALVGSEMIAGNTFVEANKEYTFTVTQKGVSASTTFTVDDVITNAVVTATNATKKTITVNNNLTFVVPENITIDYAEAFGRTISVWYDQKMVIQKFAYANETVLTGAFGVINDSTGIFLEDYQTGNLYPFQTTPVMDGTRTVVAATQLIERTTTPGFGIPTTYVAPVHDTLFNYATVTLNAYGNVKTIATLGKDILFELPMLVDKVNGTVISSGTKTEKNLKDFTIVKDGKTIAVSDIQAGDVVFFRTDRKFAEVYTDKAVGKVTAVYDKKFKLDDTTYSYENASGSYKSKYVVDGLAYQIADIEYMKALKAEGKDVAIYFDRLGRVPFIMGDTGVEKTTTSDIVLIKNAAVSSAGFVDTIRFEGYVAGTKKTLDVNVANLKSVVTGNNAGFDTHKFDNVAKKFALNGNALELQTVTGGAVSTVISDVTTVAANSLIKVKTNEAGVVVGLDFATSDNFNGAQSTEATFKNGFKVINTYQIASTVPVYTFNTTGTVVSATTYGEFVGQVTTANLVQVYKKATTAEVYALVILPGGITSDSTNAIIKKGVVSNKKTFEGDLVELTVVFGNETETFTSIAADYAHTPGSGTGSALTTGDIVTVTLSKDGKTVISTAGEAPTCAESVAITDVVAGTNSFKVGGVEKFLASNTTPTIVKMNAYGTAVSAIDFNELLELATKYKVSISYSLNSTTYVDTIVVTNEEI